MSCLWLIKSTCFYCVRCSQTSLGVVRTFWDDMNWKCLLSCTCIFHSLTMLQLRSWLDYFEILVYPRRVLSIGISRHYHDLMLRLSVPGSSPSKHHTASSLVTVTTVGLLRWTLAIEKVKRIESALRLKGDSHFEYMTGATHTEENSKLCSKFNEVKDLWAVIAISALEVAKNVFELGLWLLSTTVPEEKVEGVWNGSVAAKGEVIATRIPQNFGTWLFWLEPVSGPVVRSPLDHDGTVEDWEVFRVAHEPVKWRKLEIQKT